MDDHIGEADYRRGRGLITGVGRGNLSNYLSEMGGAICPKMEIDRPKTKQGGQHVWCSK